MENIPQIRYVKSFDKTKIAYYVIGKSGPAMILSNGLGGNIISWKYLTDFFGKDFRIYSWDYRGLYGSEYIEGSDLSIEAHCHDLKAMLEAENIEKAVFLGWSMGVQVNFEFYRKYPSYISSLIQINGTYENPFKTAFNSEWFHSITPHFLYLIEHVLPKIQFLGRFITKTRGLIRAARFAGLLSTSLDEDLFIQLVKDWFKLNFVNYSRIFKQLSKHNAKKVLNQIKIPTLIITGEKDLFTPLSLSRKMQEMISGCELLVVRTGTHFCPVEFPELVNLRIEKFLKEHGLYES